MLMMSVNKVILSDSLANNFVQYFHQDMDVKLADVCKHMSIDIL